MDTINELFPIITLSVLECFAGYGSQNTAFQLIAKLCPWIKIKIIGIFEFDEYAAKAYQLLHGKDIKNYGDITKIEDWNQVVDFDAMTYSGPCQDISKAGKQKGFEKDSGTRSATMWDCLPAITAKRPKFLLMENVDEILNKKFAKDFNAWKESLNELGYDNYVQVINAKDFGVPQNRERCFMVSILREESKTTGDSPSTEYNFPTPEPLIVIAESLLEKKVSDSYYFKFAA